MFCFFSLNELLEQIGYVKIVNIQNIKAGFEVTLYEITAITYAVLLLDSSSLEALFKQMDEIAALGLMNRPAR